MTGLNRRQVERAEREFGRTLDLVEILGGKVDKRRVSWEDEFEFEDDVLDPEDELDDEPTEEEYELGEAA